MCCKQTGCDGTPDTVHHMYCNCTDRIIDVKLVIQQPYTEANQKTCNCADDDRTESICYITRSCDCYQTCQRCVQTHRNIRLTILDPGKDHTYNRCNGRSDGRGQEYTCQLLLCGAGCTVKSVPAKPQDEYTKCAYYNVMSRKSIYFYDLAVFIFFKLTDTRANHLGTNQSCNTTYHMDCCGTCKIVEAHLCQPAAAPDPVCLDRVDQCGNDAGVYTVA